MIKGYEWLVDIENPKFFTEALNLYGTKEVVGKGTNPQILMWAKEINAYIGIEYTDDSMPWCGIFIGVVMKRAGHTPPYICCRAKQWLKFGRYVNTPMLWDVLIFGREGGGHVGFYVGEDTEHYHVLGGNQKDCVCIIRIKKDRLEGARRVDWSGKPRKVFLTSSGEVSQNEA